MKGPSKNQASDKVERPDVFSGIQQLRYHSFPAGMLSLGSGEDTGPAIGERLELAPVRQRDGRQAREIGRPGHDQVMDGGHQSLN